MLTPRQKTSVHQFQTHIEREARTNRDEQGLIGDEEEMGGRELLWEELGREYDLQEETKGYRWW